MSRRLSLDVKDCASFVRDVSGVVFVPGPSEFQLGERVVLDVSFENGERATLPVKVLGARHFASRSLGRGVFVSPEHGDHPALLTVREKARAAQQQLERARQQRHEVSVFFTTRDEAESELRGLLDAAGAVLPTGTAHQRGDHLAVTVVVGGATLGVLLVTVHRVHVQDGMCGVVAIAEDRDGVVAFLAACQARPATPTATTTPGQTTTQTVQLPRAQAGAWSMSPPRALPSSLSVLVVDDDADFRVVTSRLLERRGHRVTTTDTAIGIADRVAALRPDVVCLDRGLAGVTGDEAAHRLAVDARTAGTPVLLTSAAPMASTLASALHPRCTTFLKTGRGSDTLAAIEERATMAVVSPLHVEPRLLLAEDDVDVREEAAAWLESAGFHISTASDGSEAIKALVGGLRPDAIVLDLMMPVVSGWAVFEWLRASPHCRIPVIIWTAAGAATGTDMLRDAPVVEKGKNPQILLDTIRASTLWARDSYA